MSNATTTAIPGGGPGKRPPPSLVRSLKLQQLVVFEQVVDAGTILAASRELAMTQPAVSKSIQELERHLGELLFARGRRGVVLTEFGREFERHAKTLLADLRHLAEGVDAWRTGTAGHVVVGTLITASTTLLPDAIVHLRRSAPDVTIEVKIGSNATLFPALMRGDVDIVVGFLPTLAASPLRGPDRRRLAHVPLYDEALCIVTGRSQSAASRRKPSPRSLRDLHPMEWILPTPDSAAYGAACALFDDEGLPLPSRVVYSVSILTNIGLLTRSAMVGLMPHSAAEPFEKAGLVSILPLGAIGTVGTVGYTMRADRPANATLARLVDALHAAGEPSRHARGTRQA